MQSQNYKFTTIHIFSHVLIVQRIPLFNSQDVSLQIKIEVLMCLAQKNVYVLMKDILVLFHGQIYGVKWQRVKGQEP